MSLPNPLSAIQLLWVNLTTDSLPAIALGLERADDSLMQKPPIKADSPLFSAERVFRIVFEGILIGVLAVSAFVIGSNMRSVTVGSTMCFFVLGASQLFHSFNMQSEKSIFARRKQKNIFVFVSFVVCLCMQICSISIPFFANLFSVVALNATEWIICFALSICPVAISEIYKRFKK
jgi:Ca2+-transporting ATPase